MSNGTMDETLGLQSLAGILSQLQRPGALGGTNPAGGGGPDIIRSQGAPPSSISMPPLPPGSMASQLPQYSPGAGPVGPRPITPPQGGMQQSGYSFDNPKARNAAVVDNAMKSLTSFIDQNKQHKYQQQVEEAKGVVATVLRTSQAVDKANQSGDKDTAKLIQDQANKMLGSKEAAKILKDLNKPGSAAYYGAQQAYKDVQAESQQKLSMQEMQAKIQAEQARAQAEAARQQAELQRARSESPEAKTELENLKAKHKLEELDLVQKAISGRTDKTLTERFNESVKRNQTSIDVARIHADAIKANAANKQGKSVADELTRAYSSISRQRSSLSGEMMKYQKELADHPIEGALFTEQTSETKAKIAGLQSKLEDLDQQEQMLELKRQTALQYGIIQEGTGAVGPPKAPSQAKPTDPNDDLRKLMMDMVTGPSNP